MVNNHGSRKNKSLIIPDVGKITYDNFVSNTLMIRNTMSSIVDNFMLIGKELKFVKDNKIFKLGDYKSFIDYCKTEFGINKSQAYNFINVYERFSDDSYKKYNYSSLVEMLSLNDEQVKKVPPGATVKEVREIKKKEKVREEEKNIPYVGKNEEEVPVIIEGQFTVDDFVKEKESLFDDFQVNFLIWLLDNYHLRVSLDYQDKFDKSKKLLQTFGKDKIDISTELGIIKDILLSTKQP